MILRLLPSIALVSLFMVHGSVVRGELIPPEALAGWEVWGGGSVRLRAETDAIELREGEGSGGVSLVSSRTLPIYSRVRLELKPLQREGVVVLMLADASVEGGTLRPPPGHRGDIGFWRDAVRGWAFGLHTGFHQPNAFIAALPGWEIRVDTPDPAPDERWYRVEVGRDAATVWLRVDDKPALELPLLAAETGATEEGKFVLRLRGPGDGTFSCLFRRMEWIPGQESKAH